MIRQLLEVTSSHHHPITSSDLPVVVHFVERFLAVTENWIYHQVVSSARYRPVVATEGRENADQFPFEAILYPDWGSRCPVPGGQGARCPVPGARLGRARFGAGHRALGTGHHSPGHRAPLSAIGPWLRRRNRVAVPLQVLSRAYERRVREVGPALLHAHFGTQAVHLLRLRRRLGVPLVTTFYGYDASSIPALPGWREWYRRLFAAGDRFLVEGGAFRERLLDLGCPPEKATVQHLGVDLEAIPFCPRQPRPGEPIRLLMAAGFREKKGHEYALRAFAAARQQLAIELRLIGDGKLRPRIEGLIRELGIGDAVVLLGARPHAAFLEEALRCHLFLSPSVTASDGDTEGGAPVGIIEASASGMPVVASRHADIPEVVRDGETGWLAPERDVEALTAHMVGLLERPETWPAIGERARRHIEAEYNLRTQARRLEAIYDEVRQQATSD